MPKDKKDVKAPKCDPKPTRRNIPIRDLHDTGQGDNFYIFPDDDSLHDVGNRRDPAMSSVNRKTNWTPKLNFKNHKIKWVQNDEPYVIADHVKIRTNFFLDNTTSQELKGLIAGYVAFGWNKPSGEMSPPTEFSAIYINDQPIESGAPFFDASSTPAVLIDPALPWDAATRPYDVNASAGAGDTIVDNIEKKIPNFALPWQLLKHGWNTLDFEIYINPSHTLRTDAIEGFVRQIGDPTDPTYGNVWETHTVEQFFGLLVKFFDVPNSIYAITIKSIIRPFFIIYELTHGIQLIEAQRLEPQLARHLEG